MLRLALERTTASSDSWIAERDVWIDGVDRMMEDRRSTSFKFAEMVFAEKLKFPAMDR